MANFHDVGTAGVLPRPRRSAKKPGGGRTAPPGAGDGNGGRGEGDGTGGEGGSGARDDGLGPFALGLALVGITTLFVVLIAVWLLLRRPAADWPLPGPDGSVHTLWISSACLVASSVAVELSARRARRGLEWRREALRWLVASLVLALAFLGAQTWLWSSLWSAGLVPSSSGYAAVLFALTGLHALHVLGGIAYLASLARALAKKRSSKLPSVRLGAIYWHFMGAIWLVLFTLLTFVG